MLSAVIDRRYSSKSCLCSSRETCDFCHYLPKLLDIEIDEIWAVTERFYRLQYAAFKGGI
jgi:hypothetical protein